MNSQKESRQGHDQVHQQQSPYHVNAKRTEHKFTPLKDTFLMAAVDMESSVKALVNHTLHSYVSSKD